LVFILRDMYLAGTTLTCGKFEFITVIMVNIKVFWDVKPCLLVNSNSLYQFTRVKPQNT